MSNNGWVTISAIASRPGEIRVTIDSKNPKLEKNEFSDQVPYHYRMYYEASLRDIGTLKADFTNRMQGAGKFLGADRFSCTIAEATQTIRHLVGANILAEYGGTDSYEKEFAQQQELTKQRIQAVNLPRYAGGKISGTSVDKYEEKVLNDFAGCKPVIIFKSLIPEYIETIVISTIIVYLLKNNTEYLDTKIKSDNIRDIFVFSFGMTMFWVGIKSLFTNEWKLYDLTRHIKIIAKISVVLVIGFSIIAVGIHFFEGKITNNILSINNIIKNVIYGSFYTFLILFCFSFPFVSTWSTIERKKYNIEPGKKDCDFCQEPLLPSQMLADNYEAKKLWQCPKCGQRVIADSYRIIAANGVSLNKP